MPLPCAWHLLRRPKSVRPAVGRARTALRAATSARQRTPPRAHHPHFALSQQTFYLVVTEIFFRPNLTCDTSIRALTRPKPAKPPPSCYTGITYAVYRIVSRLGIMRRGELFDPEHWKTKVTAFTLKHPHALLMPRILLRSTSAVPWTAYPAGSAG